MGLYAAENSFLDAFAHRRRSEGLSCLSVNWGPVASPGMATEQRVRVLEKNGLKTITADQALERLERLLSSETAQCAILSADWEKFASSYEARTGGKLLSELAVSKKRKRRTNLLEKLDSMEPDRRAEAIRRHLDSEIRRITESTKAELDDLDRGFFDLGMDSLMIVELVRDLGAEFNDDIPAAITFELSTPARLADHLLKLHFPESAFVEKKEEIEIPETENLEDALSRELSMIEEKWMN